MKKCASCTKDLPDAALHCVFCGAKQAPAPAVNQAAANAKTVMGSFSAQEMIEHIRQSGTPIPGQPPASAAVAPAPASPASPAPPAYAPPPSHPYTPPQAQPPALDPLAPASYPQAQTMMAPAPQAGSFGAGPGAAKPSPYQAPAPAPYVPPAQPQSPPPSMPPPVASGVGVATPQDKTMAAAPAPQIPVVGPAGTPVANPYGPGAVAAPVQAYGVNAGQPAVATPPYLASQTSARAGRPVDPWRETMRTVMFIFGCLTLITMFVPVSISPLHMRGIDMLSLEGTAMLKEMIIAAMGLLGVLLAFLPMPTAARGMLAGLLGLAVVVVPIVLGDMSAVPWQHLVQLAAMLFLLPGLILRTQYRESAVPRILVTLGALAYLATMLIPNANGSLPLVGAVQQVIGGHIHTNVLEALVETVIAVLCLLVWLPAPSGGGAKIWAWLFILILPLAFHALTLVFDAHDPIAVITHNPGTALLRWEPTSAALAFIAYGWASVFGKSLE